MSTPTDDAETSTSADKTTTGQSAVPSALETDPADKIIIRRPFDQAKVVELSVKNVGGELLCVKMKATRRYRFKIHPARITLQPGESAKLRLTQVPFELGEFQERTGRFSYVYTVCPQPDFTGTPPHEWFSDPTKLHRKELKIVYVDKTVWPSFKPRKKLQIAPPNNNPIA